MITRLMLANFKAHVHTDVALRPFTVLVGANGVGKTSMLEGLHILAESIRTPLERVFQGRWDPVYLARRVDIPIQLAEVFRRSDGDENHIRLEFDLHPGANLSKGTVSPGGNSFDETQSFFSRNPKHPLVHETGSVSMVRLSALAIARGGRLKYGDSRVAYDGSGTAAVIADWKLSDDERLNLVTDALREIVPHVRALRARPVASEGAGGGIGFTLFVDFDDARNVPAELVSEGTLVALALLVLLHSTSHPTLVLLDDLGAALHPSAQAELVPPLKHIQAQNPLLQIVASTHSPYVLDAVDPADVLVFARGKDGAARVRPLSEHPNANVEGITTGQLWTMDPESWVLEGEP